MPTATEEEDNIRRAFHKKPSSQASRQQEKPGSAKDMANRKPVAGRNIILRYFDIIIGDITKIIRTITGQSEKEIRHRQDQETYNDFMAEHFPGMK